MIVMPGLINAHQHAWLGLLRGLMPNVDAIGDYMGDPADPGTLLHGRRLRPRDAADRAIVAGRRRHDLAGRVPQHA
jgi:cytosine/adenosine deaminase-related metal-dependent hydrolase